MNEIKVKVKFKKGLCYSQGINLVTNDYNSTKLVFEFDESEGTKIFEMKDPDNNLIFADEILNNELVLIDHAIVTTKVNNVTYIKYTDGNDTIYWYDEDTEKLYDSEFVEIQNVDVDTLTKVTKDISLFKKPGNFIYEISLYKDNSKLTSVADKLKVKEEQVIIDGEIVQTYTPMFDNLLSDLAGALQEADNLDIEITKEDVKAYFTITKKDGTQETTELSAGLDGTTPTIGENGNWYLGDVDTGKPSRGEKGDKGDKGDTGLTGATGAQGPQGERGLQGPQGERGLQGLKGDTGSAGNDGISPIATVTQTVTGATISITDKNGTTTANISNGDASNYSVLNNKPLINNVTLSGNKTSSDLGLQPAGNYALSSEIPTKTSDLTNDSGYITGYTETDPTVPSHVKNITQANITSWNNKSEFSGNYNDLSNKPTIPSEVTESTVGGWGFTKNTGTYSKPNDGIPKADLASAVQTSLGKADTALQTHQDISGKVDIFNDTASGSPAYFIDGLDYFANSVIINIEPVQAGTGTPSPTNIRNITGLTGTVLNVAGEDVQEATTINISWQSEAGTIYGGVLNLTTGVLTKTKALVEYAVSDMNNSESYPGWKNTGIGEIIGSGVQAKITAQLNVGSNLGINTTGTASTVYLPPASYNNLNQTAWKTQYPDLVIQIVVEYETPITYQLTPQEVRILAGINNIWATCGDVTVNYKADTKKYIDSRIQAIEDRLSLLEG